MNDAAARYLDGLGQDRATAELLRCCRSTAWARRMVAARPFRTGADLERVATEVWRDLGEDDWLEAFAGHPRIGERERDGATADWSRAEQAGAAGADVDTSHLLAQYNKEYEDKFGFVFLICATGLDAPTMLGRLRERLDHDRGTELRIAAAEQATITALRLEKLAVP